MSAYIATLLTWLTWIDCLLRGPRPLLCMWPRPAPFHIRLSVLDMPHMLTVFFLLLSRWDLCKSWVWPSLTSWNVKMHWNYIFFICPYPKYQMPWRCLLNSTKSSTPSKRLHFFLTWIYSCSFSWVQSIFRSFFCKWGRLSKSYCGPILKRGISSLDFWIISLLISECLMNYFCINLSIMNFLNCRLDA